MESQTEFAEALHSLCDFREFSALAPSALNHVRQKCEAGEARRLKSSAPISARLAHKGTAFSPSISESVAGGIGGYTRQKGREGCVVHPEARAFLNPLGPEVSPFCVPFSPEEALNSGRVKEQRSQGALPSKQGWLKFMTPPSPALPRKR